MKLISGMAAALLTLSATAQVVIPPSSDPGALQQRRLEEEQRRQELERLQRKPATDPVRIDAEKIAPSGVQSTLRFMLREIRFSPASEVFSADELKTMAREFEGREITFADLQQLIDRINAEYRKRGVVTAQAVIPPQDVSSGSIEVRLVEGKVGAIQIDGNAYTNESYIRNRIGLSPGKLVDLPILEQSLKRFNSTNDAQLGVELKPGEFFGSTDLYLNVIEAQRHDFRFTADNFGSRSTGETRYGITYITRSLLGFSDNLSLSSTHSGGLDSYSADYGFPINRLGGRMNLSYNKDYTDIKGGPFAALGITGESISKAMSLRQPIYFGERSQVTLQGGAKKRETNNWISGIFLSSTETEDANIGVEYQATDNAGLWFGNYSLFAGHADTVTGSDHYTIARGSLLRSQNISDGWYARGALSFQHTDHVLLPSSEQFFIGGEGSVRGFPPGAYSGDQGATLSLELHHPLGRLGVESSRYSFLATGFFFADTGRVKSYIPPQSIRPQYENLSSLGWGADTALGKNVTARATYSYTLNSLPLMPRHYSITIQLVASLL